MFLKKIKLVTLLGCAPMFLPGILLRGQVQPDGEPSEVQLESEGPMIYEHQTQQYRATGGARLQYEQSLLTAEEIAFNQQTQIASARGNPRLHHDGSLLSANEILFNQQQRLASAQGNGRITSPGVRLVGDQLGYNLDSERGAGSNLRFGSPPFYAQAATVNAASELVELDTAVAYFGEPRPGAINLRARTVRYYPNERVEAEHVTLRIGRVPFFYLPRLSRNLDSEVATEATAEAGYTSNLGAYGFLGTRTPLFPGFSAGPEIGYYRRRGLLLGPGFNYHYQENDSFVEGGLSGGFIKDQGEVGTDRLDRPVDDNRYYAQWRHKQHVGDRFEVTGVADIWSDSEATRDFRPRVFSRNQFPNNFLEAVYLGDGYLVSAFTRVAGNDFEVVPERLPEVRIDVLPRPLGAADTGIYQQMQVSGAVLREDDPLGPDTRSDRLDLYYGISRPFVVTDWLTFTPKAGARVTHYDRAMGDRDNYTRVLGEIGADLEANAFTVYDYQNDLWQIDDIRHIVKPRIEYRYIPNADRGRRFIPQVDRQVFSTHLEPIDLGRIRNIDELDETHTLRYGLQNSFQTRHPTYGSTDLLSLYLANDLRFSREPGQEFVSDVHAELAFTPIYWLRLDALSRVSPQQPEMREITTGLTLTDARFWSLRLGSEFVDDRLEEYNAFFSRRLNETYRIAAEVRFDAVQNRFSRQTYSLLQNFYDTWEVQYSIYLRSGAERESPTGYSISFSYLSF